MFKKDMTLILLLTSSHPSLKCFHFQKDALHRTEIIRTNFRKMLDEYCDKGETPYSGDSDFYLEWLFQYYKKFI